MCNTRLVIFLVFSLIPCYSLDAATIFVKSSSLGSNTGLNWKNAFNELQDALDIATSGDSIWVAEGTYYPTNGTDRYSSFIIPSGVKIFGGFIGTETSFSDRDWVIFPTVLSGNIGDTTTNFDNSFTIAYLSLTDTTTTLDGLTFSQGNANSNVDSESFNGTTKSGGAIYIDGTQGNTGLQIKNCYFTQNSAAFYGGAIQLNGTTSFRIINSVFENNIAGNSGGAINKRGGCQLVQNIENCNFFNNHSDGYGGAICVRFSQCNLDFILFNCEFNFNNSDVGGAFSKNEFQNNSNSTVKVLDCEFNSNSAFSSGAAIYDIGFQTGNLEISNSSFSFNFGKPIIEFENGNFSNSLDVVNSIFFKNEQPCIVAASDLNIYNNLFYNNSTRCVSLTTDILKNNYFINNTFLYNNTDIGVFEFRKSNNHFHNNIFWGNTSAFNDDFYILYDNSVSFKNCIFEEADIDSIGYLTFATSSTIEFLGQNQFGIYPEFRDTANGDFTLRSCSPAVNAGDNSFIDSFLIETDIRDFPRILNGTVDIGAYEQQAIDLEIEDLQNVTCKGFNDGQIALALSGLSPFYLSSPSVPTADTLNTNLSPGNYTFYLEDADQCADTLVAEITEADSLLAIANTVLENVLCFGDSSGQIVLTASGGVLPYTFLWEDSTAGNVREDLLADIYPVTITDDNQCTIIDSFAITEPPELLVIFNVGNTPTDSQNGSIATESIIGGTPPYDYLWSTGATSDGIGGLSAGLYSLTITDAVGCDYFYEFEVDFISNINNALYAKYAFDIYPNPVASDFLIIDFKSPEVSETLNFQLFNSLGKNILNAQLADDHNSIHLQSIPAGFYTFLIINAQGKIVTNGKILRL